LVSRGVELVVGLPLSYQSAVLPTSQTLTPAERACLTIFAVPRPPGNASAISGLPSANILLLRIGPAPVPNCPQSAWKTCTGTRLNPAQWLRCGVSALRAAVDQQRDDVPGMHALKGVAKQR
jgi:hypothetical protein